MTIRAYDEGDWERVKAIFNKAKPDEFRAYTGLQPILPLEDDPMLLRLFYNSIISVAERDGCILGFAGTKGALISWLYVDPEFYRSGVGSELLQKIMLDIGEKAWLTVAAKNTPALGLYRKFGFRYGEMFIAPYLGVEIEVLRMALHPESRPWEDRPWKDENE